MPIFFTKKSCNRGGWNHPPQMPLTVKKYPIVLYCFAQLLLEHPPGSNHTTFCGDLAAVQLLYNSIAWIESRSSLSTSTQFPHKAWIDPS